MNDETERREGDAGEPRGGSAGEGASKLPPGLVRVVAAFAVSAVVLYLFLYEGIWKWGLSRVYVNPGEMLVLKANFGEENPNVDELVVVPEPYKGMRERVYGEGRHFFNPIVYDRDTSQRIIEIKPGEIGLVESKSGKALPPEEFLADPGYKGILKRVLTPGKWRLNPYAYVVTPMEATIIDPGFVGCVTSLAGKPSKRGELALPGQRGILAEVLQPGIHYLNPREFKIDVVEIGFRELSLADVQFPSRDGFSIQLDISVVWGIEPQEVPWIINSFGNLEDVIRKVIRPQVESICRIEGSKYGAKEFIEGETREKFQLTFTDQLEKVCAEKHIAILIGLVRQINVPNEVRLPIQQGKIAVEENLTKIQQKVTQTVKNELEELKADVRKGVAEVEAETRKLVAEIDADGKKQVAEIEAETGVAVAAVNYEASQLEAQKERMLGKAQAEVEELMQTAKADELSQAIAALGTPDDYARYIFAKGLPDDIKIFLRYAGPGTFWTDLPDAAKSMEKLAAAKILENEQKEQKKSK